MASASCSAGGVDVSTMDSNNAMKRRATIVPPDRDPRTGPLRARALALRLRAVTRPGLQFRSVAAAAAEVTEAVLVIEVQLIALVSVVAAVVNSVKVGVRNRAVRILVTAIAKTLALNVTPCNRRCPLKVPSVGYWRNSRRCPRGQRRTNSHKKSAKKVA